MVEKRVRAERAFSPENREEGRASVEKGVGAEFGSVFEARPRPPYPLPTPPCLAAGRGTPGRSGSRYGRALRFGARWESQGRVPPSVPMPSAGFSVKPDSFRFPDVPVAPTAELLWVLHRAFGPSGQAAAGAVDGECAVAMATRLSVASRIGCRAAQIDLSPEVGSKAARALREAFHADAARAVLLQAVAREVLAVVAGFGVRCALLKFCALRARGVLELGSRAAGDVDVLVPEKDGRRLCAALVAAGCRQERGWAGNHQFSPLWHPSGVMIEVHRAVPGVGLGGRRRAASFDDLRRVGLLQPEPVLGPTTFLPTRRFLVAHAVIHGLAQHGLAPQSYPLLRMVADVHDLGVADEEWSALDNGDPRIFAGVVSQRELAAAWMVCQDLREGRAPALLGGVEPSASAAARLLRHMLAGRLNERYAAYLNARGVLRAPVGENQVGFLARRVARVLVNTPLAIEKRHGRPRSGWEWTWRVLTRPFELAAELARHLSRLLGFRARVIHGSPAPQA